MEKVVVDWDWKSQKLEDRKSKIVRCFKTCLKCGETKQIRKFSTDKRNRDGRVSICKLCRGKESLNYYYENKAEILVQNKKYRDDHRGQRTIYFQDYQENHKEHLQKVAAIWYKKNRKRIKRERLEKLQTK